MDKLNEIFNAPPKPASGALLEAAQKNDFAALKELLDGGADINERDRWGTTALIWAAAYGHTDIARELIGRGALLDVVDQYNCTARDEALRLGYKEIVQMIDGAEKQQMKPPQPRI